MKLLQLKKKKRKSQLFGHLFCCIVTCVITINCKLHFSSVFCMLKVAHFQCGKYFAFYILQFLPFAFIFLFTPQPQRLIELVRVVAVEAWSWSRCCLESWRSVWKCCTREKRKLSRSWCWKGNAFVALGGGNLRATLTTPSYRYRYFTTLRYILRPISVLHASHSQHTHTSKQI